MTSKPVELTQSTTSTTPTTYIQLTKNDIKTYRKRLREEQGDKCAICKDDLKGQTGVSLDHQHKRKCDPIGLNGGGLVRGVLCRDCNVFEGKIWNASKRYKKHHILPTFLRSVADYLEKDNYPWIHPSEKPKPRKVSKRQYNKLKKVMQEHYEKFPLKRNVCPLLSKKQTLTQQLQTLFKRYQISPFIE